MARLESEEKGNGRPAAREDRSRVEARRERALWLPLPSTRQEIKVWKEVKEASECSALRPRHHHWACAPGSGPLQNLRTKLGR